MKDTCQSILACYHNTAG